MNTLYKIRDLRQEYANKAILEIDKLDISEGEILGITGSNGSGKSTLLRHLCFLECAKSGTLLYKNFSYSKIPLEIKREINILLPDPYLLKRSVKENLLFGLKIRDDNKEIDKRVEEVMELVGLLPRKFLKRKWFELSSGETQRLCLASRLILKPRVLLLDEPTNSLDISGIPLFSQAIKYANERWGTTFIIATHDLHWLQTLSTRKISIHFGKIVEHSLANLLIGGWEQEGDSLIYQLNSSQKLTITKEKKIESKKGVVINPREIKIFTEDDHTNKNNLLKATINNISSLEVSNEISIKAAIGHNRLEAIISLEEYKNKKLFPTQEIYLKIEEDSIKSL